MSSEFEEYVKESFVKEVQEMQVDKDAGLQQIFSKIDNPESSSNNKIMFAASLGSVVLIAGLASWVFIFSGDSNSVAETAENSERTFANVSENNADKTVDDTLNVESESDGKSDNDLANQPEQDTKIPVDDSMVSDSSTRKDENNKSSTTGSPTQSSWPTSIQDKPKIETTSTTSDAYPSNGINNLSGKWYVTSIYDGNDLVFGNLTGSFGLLNFSPDSSTLTVNLGPTCIHSGTYKVDGGEIALNLAMSQICPKISGTWKMTVTDNTLTLNSSGKRLVASRTPSF